MSSVTLHNFKGLDTVISRIVKEKAREVTYNVWWEVVDWTPVCSGKAAASWDASAGVLKSFTNIPDPEFNGKCTRIHDDPRNGVSGPDSLLGAASDAHNKWFVVNTASYVRGLNDGSINTAKAPIGFIEIGVDRGIHKSGRLFTFG
ncbi:MAG: hypothetical protein GY696_25170 [Gammaproteobacteria bacterium]|nr:hypothetical protein [Gammaproteobacteria bacterium]